VVTAVTGVTVASGSVGDSGTGDSGATVARQW
jgi:hypothetical protein